MKTLVLLVTRQCNLRCSYCPTVKDGWPVLTPADARAAIDLFVERSGGGEVKLFGGEPLLEPATVRAAIDAASASAAIDRITLCTNGVGLDREWCSYLEAHPKAVTYVSIDGTARDHRRFRRSLPDVEDSYDVILRNIEWLTASRVIVTQVIPPATASSGAENFRHLVSLGFRRFKFLPAFYMGWTGEQLRALRQSFDGIASEIAAGWSRGEYFYVRNLFSLAPQPTFNSAMVVDADRRIYGSDITLTDIPDAMRIAAAAGDLDHPPDAATISAAAARVTELLPQVYSPHVWQSTIRADAELTRFCGSLYKPFRVWRASRTGTAMQEHDAAAAQ